MYVPEKLKLNKFVLCNIPSPRELFARLGLLSVGNSNQYTGDDIPPTTGTKVDVLADMLEFDAVRQREEDEKKPE